jgi:hypothetical protein
LLNVAVRAALFAQEHPLRQCERDLESDCGEMQKRIVHSGTLPALQGADLSARVYADRRLRSAQCSAQARARKTAAAMKRLWNQSAQTFARPIYKHDQIRGR